MSEVPRTPAAILRHLLPLAEREEVMSDLRAEHASRVELYGAAAARRWVWRQVLGSVPALIARTWWRGTTGFEPRANRAHPGGPAMEGWIIDARYTVRRLVRRPTYALLAILTLALGVGGTAAIFAIARGLLVDKLPIRDEEEVAAFWMAQSWTDEEFLFLRGRFPGFAEVGSYRPLDVTMQDGDAPAHLLPGMATSHEFFSVLGVTPRLGRAFREGDDVPGAEPVVVISHGLWNELGGDPSLIGRTLRIDGVARTVVGVMPAGFWFPDPGIRVWMPHPLSADRRSGIHSFVGRVTPGQSARAMQPSLDRLRQMIDERFEYPPQWDKRQGVAVTPVRDALVGPMRPALLATLAAMALTLLIACANVSALLLGQVEGRRTELAVRSALGAGRSRIVRHVALEALVIGIAAGAVGAGVAVPGFRAMTGALLVGPWSAQARPDWGVFVIAMVVAVLASVVVALVPLVAIGRQDIRDALGRARTGGVSGRGGRLESGLVVAEVALAVLMTSGAALLTRSVMRLYEIDAGVEPRGVAVVDVVLGNPGAVEARHLMRRQLLQSLVALPGVGSVAATQKLPLRGSGDNWGIAVEGRPDADGTTTSYRIVTQDYFTALGVAVRRGRAFDLSDRADGERVVIVNEALARKYFPDVDPVGRRIGTGFDTTWARIIGVVENVAENALTEADVPARYMLADQLPFVPSSQALVVRLARDANPEGILAAARNAIAATAPSVAVQEATTLSRIIDRAVGPARQVVQLLGVLTALALALGAVGVYGVIAHFAARRQRDWGIRVALGLRPARVMRMVVGRGAMMVGAGVVLGVAAAPLLARLLGSLLYGVGAADPLAYGSAAVLLVVVGLVAAWIPARRAARVSPASVLRES